ncbi:MAG: glycosyltransferase, partial [Anaerolineales bacterium]
ASILGCGPERRRLEQLADSLGLAGRVSWQDQLPSGHMPSFYQQLDTLVLPSLSRSNWVEQFGRVLIEGMACGVPVIGSESGEIPSVIADAGLTFREGDAAALARHITRLMGDVQFWNDLSRRGRQRVTTHFTQQQVASSTVDVYRKMATGQVGD